MTTPVRVSIDDFLAMEETKPYLELIDGEVVEKAAPTEAHGILVVELCSLLSAYLRRTKEGRAMTEVRHLAEDEQRVYLPDINVTLASRLGAVQRTGLKRTHPDFAIEVLSPDDRTARVLEGVQFYLRTGVQLVWLVDPELRWSSSIVPASKAKSIAPPKRSMPGPCLPNSRSTSPSSTTSSRAPASVQHFTTASGSLPSRRVQLRLLTSTVRRPAWSIATGWRSRFTASLSRRTPVAS